MTENKNVRIGLIGCGFMGLTHLKAYRQLEGVEIVAICDAYRLPPDGDFSGIGGNIGDDDTVKLDMTKVKAYTDYKEVLADPDIDVVDICVHTVQHPEIAIAALAAGKHVVCEKPMARTSEEGRAMVEAAKNSDGFLMPAMCIRFWPEWAWLKKAIDSGEYGKVLGARFRRVAEPPGWSKNMFMDGEKSGGALLDLHIHDTDFVQYCFGKPESVFSTGYTKVSGAIDHIVTQYQVAGGASVVAEGGWAMTPGFGFSMTYTVNFEKATADYDVARGEEALKLWVEDQEVEIVSCAGGDGYIGELQHAVECAATGTRPTLVTVEDGASAVEICEAEEESIRTGQPVKL